MSRIRNTDQEPKDPEKVHDSETGRVIGVAGEWEPGDGGWSVRSIRSDDPAVDEYMNRDHYAIPKVIPQNQIMTQAMYEGKQRIEQACDSCGREVGHAGPGVIPSRTYGKLICRECAMKGSAADRLLAGLVTRARGRQPRNTGEGS